MLKSFTCLIAPFVLMAPAESILSAQVMQEARSPGEARHVRVLNREVAVYPNICIHPNSSMSQIEPSIATHPSNPNTVFAVSITSSTVAPVVTTGWHYTTDGGVTWTGRDTLPTFSNLSLNMVDPAVGIDADGTIYAGGLYGVLGSAFDVYVARSTDNGTNWSQTIIPSPINADNFHLTIDVNPNSPYRNYLYAAYSEHGMSAQPIRFTRSIDRGQSFSTPVTISGTIGSVQSHFPILAMSPDSVLYATWSGFDGPWPGPIRQGFNNSTDGGASWGTATSIRTLTGIPYLNKGGNTILVTTNPTMAVDRSTGPRRGWIYIAYDDRNPNTPDILLIRSTDRGNTWSNPTKVNQDNSGNDQWHPWISVDPSTGNLFVVYYDSRNFPANDSAQVYISASTDGGETFRDFLVSDAPFLPAQGRGVISPPAGYMGGYIGITALQGVVWPCWNDNRTGIHQVYAARIPASVIVGVDDIGKEIIPTAFALEQNYPNPFNPSTVIGYEVSGSGFVSLRVYDLLGREVATLVNENKAPGKYEVTFDASGMGSGVYFYRLSAGQHVENRKMILMK